MPPKQRQRRAVCQHHVKGHCKKGEQCPNLHAGLAGSGATQPIASTSGAATSQPTNPSPRKISDRMAPQGVCREFWTSGNCRRGEDCRFRHESPEEEGDRPVTSTPAAPVKNAPNGVCRSYWQNGKCDRSFDCTYKHERQDDATGATPSATRPGLHPAPTINKIMTPDETITTLNRYKRPGFKFFTSLDIYVFTNALSSARDDNPGWDLGDGNMLLKNVGDPASNWFPLFDHIIRHQRVTMNAGRDKVTLSFQRGYLPMISYLTSTFVVRSTLHTYVNALYGLLDANFENFARIVEACLQSAMDARSFSESPQKLSGRDVFRPIAECLLEYAGRFKKAVSTHPTFSPLTQNISVCFDQWAASIPSGFDDEVSLLSEDQRAFLLGGLRKTVQKLVDMVDLAEGSTRRTSQPTGQGRKEAAREAAMRAGSEMTYEGPGVQRAKGPRHDNDSDDIGMIRIAPTHAELMCMIDPYLPDNFPGGQHHLPNSSMARLLDIHFRLLREELISPIRSSLNLAMEALRTGQPPSLGKMLLEHGGIYKPQRGDRDAVLFSVYTGVDFEGMRCDTKDGLSIEISLNAPPKARKGNAAGRADYWESVGKKRLMQGSLVALVWKRAGGQTTINLGTITSNLKSLVASSRETGDRVRLSFSFFDSEVLMKVVALLQRGLAGPVEPKYLIEAPIMFESIRPFLETLQKVPSTSVPFARYLAHPDSGSLKSIPMDVPSYASRPGFSFDLKSLFDHPVTLKLRPSDPESVKQARTALKNNSRLDLSQADAVVDALTSEISLIQGPPGTGKSFTGVEIIRTLISNKIRPILLIAFTNHALDNILLHVLEKQITNKVVRLGGRSNDEVVSEYSLDNLALKHSRSLMASAAKREYSHLKKSEEEMDDLLKSIVNRQVDPRDLLDFLKTHYPNHEDELANPPEWVAALYSQQDHDGWQTVGRDGPTTLLDFWLDGADLKFLQPPAPPPDETPTPQKCKGKKAARPSNLNQFTVLATSDTDEALPALRDPISDWEENLRAFFESLGHSEPIAFPARTSPRSIPEVIDDWNVWEMILPERRMLHATWTNEIRERLYEEQTVQFNRLKDKHAAAKARWQGLRDEAKLEVLSKSDVIGCTTNGAAKLTTLLSGVAPKVLLVEEAGQVLEAHILASLVPSIEQMMLIGDPQQLRPTIDNYKLSMDNTSTGVRYRLDQSLMERLSGLGLHMSRLDVQRRMRPAIADNIRITLYKHLEDHTSVQNYPPVRGMLHNVFFLDHRHAEEGAGEESVSKSNAFEVMMVRDLVMHFLRQGIYSRSGDIVVLCAYLGQLTKIRAALSKEVTTVIDERDALQLIDHEENEGAAALAAGTLKGSVEEVRVSSRVLLRTVDNFQGEEGTIVILSLVRNSGSGKSKHNAGIGFLKSPNRTNVALSRAKHGLYILGNSDDLCAQSKMWTTIIAQLKDRDSIGSSLKIACNRHPETVTEIGTPGMMERYSPDGGCLLMCDAKLPACGHLCPHKCHSDDEEHVVTRCTKQCQRLCTRGHPCSRPCAEFPCGQCQFTVPRSLKCGHVNNVQCWRLDDPDSIACSTIVQKRLPRCEHIANMQCSQDPSQVVCKSACGLEMTCCRKICQAQCGRCQAHNQNTGAGLVTRAKHEFHPCTKSLSCQHICGGDCSDDHDCSEVICQQACQQACQHHRCTLVCSAPCAPCLEPCEWACDHHSCPVSCGAPCARLPCDLPCAKFLECGHRCQSICGEPCKIQVCATCDPLRGNDPVVDMIMQSKLSELDPASEDLDSLIITLACGHVFTVETLDGICEVQKFYLKSAGEHGTWQDLAPPPAGLQQRPVCPMCRAPINCSRYGRIFKRADLDLSERNVANHCRRALSKINQLIEKVKLDKVIKTTEKTVSALVSPEEPQAPDPRRPRINDQSTLPINAEFLGKNVQDHYNVPADLTSAWNKAALPLLAAYDQAAEVASKRPAHVQAYEAAIATLYHAYEARYEKQPELLPPNLDPPKAALIRARRDCGLPAPPRADLRFRVEAFWTTIIIRFLLVDLALGINEFIKPTPNKRLRAEWMNFTSFITQSIENDARIAVRVAEESQARKQVVKGELLVIQAAYTRLELDRARFADDLLPQTLEELKEVAQKGLATMKMRAVMVARAYRNAVDAGLEDQIWVDETFVQPAARLLDKWDDLAKRLNRGVFYQDVSKEEKLDIIKALKMGTSGEFGIDTRGHFYQCPNGHTYVIANCGGAMVRSRCPECNAVIGGGNHVLDASNSANREFEDLARDAGLGPSPWRWNQNV